MSLPILGHLQEEDPEAVEVAVSKVLTGKHEDLTPI